MKNLLAASLLTLVALTSSLRADEPTFLGTWETNWGLLVIKSTEEKITGKYTGKFSGTIEGTIKEGKLHYTWKQPNGEWGFGVFSLSDDGAQLIGTWGSKKSASNGGSWNGKRP